MGKVHLDWWGGGSRKRRKEIKFITGRCGKSLYVDALVSRVVATVDMQVFPSLNSQLIPSDRILL